MRFFFVQKNNNERDEWEFLCGNGMHLIWSHLDVEIRGCKEMNTKRKIKLEEKREKMRQSQKEKKENYKERERVKKFAAWTQKEIIEKMDFD